MKHSLPRQLIRAVVAGCALGGAVTFAADKPAELLKPADAAPAAPAKPAGPSPMKWTRYQLTDKFFSEGAAVGDFNKDGKMDVVSGPYWYDGADFANPKPRQYYSYGETGGKLNEPKPFDPIKYSDNFFAFVYDVNADGWDDIMIYGFPGKDASWFENPKDPASTKPWTRHVALDMVDNESPTLLDITGDGKPEIICNSEGTHAEGGRLGYATADWANPTAKWTWHPISPRNKGYQRFTHGLGVGDVDGDGKMDLLEKGGWWKQPADLAGDPEWKFNKVNFGSGGAQMYVYDVNGDGKNDVITSIAAHGFGLAWFEQKSGTEFTPHLIMNEKASENAQGLRISQLHAIDLVDMDGDGIKDIVTGKRWWAHGPKGDKDPEAAAMLVWFRLTRENGKPDFTAFEIDNNSGIGTQVMATDINGDKRPDVVVGNKRGVFVHIQQTVPQTSSR